MSRHHVVAWLLCAWVLWGCSSRMTADSSLSVAQRAAYYRSDVAALRADVESLRSRHDTLKQHPLYEGAVAKFRQVEAIALVEKKSLPDAVKAHGIIFTPAEVAVLQTFVDQRAEYQNQRARAEALNRAQAALQQDYRAEVESDARIGAAMIHLGGALGATSNAIAEGYRQRQPINCTTTRLAGTAFTNCY